MATERRPLGAISDAGAWFGAIGDVDELVASADGSYMYCFEENDVLVMTFSATTTFTERDTLNGLDVELRARYNGATSNNQLDVKLGSSGNTVTTANLVQNPSWRNDTLSDSSWDTIYGPDGPPSGAISVRFEAQQTGMPTNTDWLIDCCDLIVDYTAFAATGLYQGCIQRQVTASLSFPKPSWLQDGDVLILAASSIAAGSFADNNGSYPFTADLNIDPPGGTTIDSLGVLHRVVSDASAEPSTYNFTAPNGIGLAWLMVFRGADTSAIYDVALSSSYANGGTDASGELASLTTNTDDATVAAICWQYGIGGDATVDSINNSFENYRDGYLNPNNMRGALAAKEIVTAGAVGSTAFAQTNPNSREWVTLIFAVKPASAGRTVAASTEALTLTAQDATVNRERGVSAATEALTLTGQPATVNRARTVQAATEALTVTGQVATVNRERGVSAATEALTLTGQPATVDRSEPRTVDCATEALTLTGQPATVNRARTVQAATEALTLTGQAASIATSRDVDAATEALTLTGQPATVNRERGVSAATEALTLTGQPATVAKGRTIDAATEALTLTGQPATVNRERGVSAATEALTLTGQVATVNRGADRAVDCTTEALTLTAQPATVNRARTVQAATEALTLTGQPAAVAASRGVSAATEALTLTGQPATVAASRGVSAATEALTLTGQPATVSKGRSIDAATEALTLTGQVATVNRARTVQASTEALTLTGQPATVTRGAAAVTRWAGPRVVKLPPRRTRPLVRPALDAAPPKAGTEAKRPQADVARERARLVRMSAEATAAREAQKKSLKASGRALIASALSSTLSRLGK